jgi:uncharacterized protein
LRTLVLYFLLSLLFHLLAAHWLVQVLPRARKRKRLLYGIAAALSVVAPGTRMLAFTIGTETMRTIVAFALIELATIVIAIVPVAAIAIALRGAARAFRPKAEPDRAKLVTRREALERVAGVSLFGATGVALGWGVVRGRHDFALEEVVVKIPNWPKALDGYTIAQVSDIHVGAFVGDRELDEGFELVKRFKPDLVVATGDLVDFEAQHAWKLAKRLLEVPARDGAYAILGNHDYYAGARAVFARMRDARLRVLCNESIRLREGDGGGFLLTGLDDLLGRSHPQPGFAGPDLSAALANTNPDLPRILLAHQPKFFHEAMGRVALQLSGHTHGGQINPGFRPARLVMEYIAGRYERGGSTLWVNRGFGVAGPPARVAAPPEVTKIVIVSG